LDNVTEIIKDIRTRCVQASTDTLEKEDRDKISTDIQQLWEQLQQEANVTYSGRHVFSGYKTDEPVVLAKETALTKDTALTEEMTLLKGTYVPTAILDSTGATLVPAGTTLTADLKLPITEVTAGTAISAPTALAEEVTWPAGTTGTTGTAQLPDGTTLTLTSPLTGAVTLPAGTILQTGFTAATNIQTGVILPANTTLPKGTINPNVLGKIDGQNIQYEIGVGSTISVNTLGMDDLMSELFADIKEIKDGLDNYPDNGVDLHEMFDEKIKDFDNRLSETSEMTADLGSKMTRLEYTATRLTDDKTNFTELLSQTEDVDLEEVYVEFNSQYAIYQSALQATSKVIMNTLADFLR
ncbi:MAG: flgL, partial [Anaerocolumna sp.]|nr:flgL [Anaerocolumna sp.]